MAISQRHRFRRIAVALALATAFVSVCFVHAAAHSILKSSQPKARSVVQEAPDHIELVFNEPVELAFGGIQVTGPDGQRYEAGNPEHAEGREDIVMVAVAEGLPNGQYRVNWRIIAADGHPRAGKFGFRLNAPVVASPSASPTGEGMGGTEEEHGAAPAQEEDPQHAIEEATRPAEILLGVTRFFLFGGLLLLAGVFLFFAAVWLRPKGSFGQRPPQIEEVFARRTNTILRTAWRTAFVATLVSLPLQASVAAGVGLGEISGTTVWETLGTRFGLVAILRLGLLVGLALAWPWVRRSLGLRPSATTPVSVPASVGAAAMHRPVWPLALGIPITAALLLTIGLAGHAGTLPPVALNLGADLVHLLGVAVWIGGLVGLVLLAFPATRGVAETDRVGLMAPVVSRFSDYAMVAVAVIVASGVLRGYLEIRSIDGLTGTSYGLTLLVKLAAFLPLLALGAINNRYTKPRIERAAAAGAPSPQLSTLRRLVTLEIAAGILILGITAALVALAPPVGTHV
jgi:copper transport protein